MGQHLNPSTKLFEESLNSQIYVDKTGLIAETNEKINSRQKFMCVSRPRRFGKSMAMDMLSAYYVNGRDSHALFDDLDISHDLSYETHLNKYNVIKINVQMFLSSTKSVDAMLAKIKRYILLETKRDYPTLLLMDETDLVQMMSDIYAQTDHPFIILIDEWDCLFREYKDDKAAQTKYLDFLRMWLKDQEYVALAYMTGILPIKKYGTHSALNMFTEYSMTDPRDFAPYFGFTEDEVKALCARYKMSFEDAQAWYDGYDLAVQAADEEIIYSMYNPKSVVESMLSHRYGSYWNQTETYEALKVYIQLNIDGLKDKIIRMMAGEAIPVDISSFENDMTTFACADDVLTLLIHLGYLSYQQTSGTASIPNKEVSQVYVTSVKRMKDWSEVARSVEASRELLEALWNGDGERVAAGIDTAHNEISILKYNDENSLSCTINLAFYFAKEYYNIVREFPTGKGFADICFVPRPLHMDKPAAVIELKWDRSANGAIAQIKEKRYLDAFRDYHGSLLLAGINYDRERKTHDCVIERVEM